MYSTTLVGHTESSRYEEVSIHSASSVRSSASHGSSKKKIERSRSKRKSFPNQLQRSGSITTPWGSMRSDRLTQGPTRPTVTLAVYLFIIIKILVYNKMQLNFCN